MSLCVTVKTLESALRQFQSQASSTRPVLSDDDLDMRMQSVIIRGLVDTDVQNVPSVFQDISTYLSNKGVNLLDPVCMNKEKGIFRGKLTGAPSFLLPPV